MAENFNDVTDAFDGWLQALTGVRDSGGYVNHRWVNSDAPLSFNGVVQNATPKDLKVLPEGNRNDEAIKVHTTFEILEQDKIDYRGSVWLVYNVADRKIGGYYKAIAIRQDRDDT